MSAATLASALGIAEKNTGLLPDHVSFSQLDLMIKCPEAWRQRYLVGRRGGSSQALATGSTVHAGIAAMFDALVEKPKASRATLVEAAMRAAMNESRDRTEGFDLETRDLVEFESVGLIETYIAQRPTHVKPISTEKKIEVRLPDSDIPLIGYIDCEAEGQLVEIKTSAKKITVPTGAWKLQAWLYQAAVPKPMEWHVLVKQKTPLLIASAALATPYNPIVTQKAIGLASATLERIQQLYAERGPEEEWPLSGILHPWACGMCDAKNDCIYGSKL
jgi:hypothetical protein